MFDLLIKGGRIVDGTGGPEYVGDVAVRSGRIVDIGGKIYGSAREVIDATGLLVTPGFVDIHTHYDAQATWDDALDPSASHGVTTVVMGNCGVGFAPVRPGWEAALIELNEGVEDIPGAVLTEGIKWNWESFPQYLDVLASREYAMDVGAQLPHGALRAYVMGQRGANNEKATPEDITEMSRLTEEAVRAGALGISTSRNEGHQSLNGELVPGSFADRDELIGFAQGLQRGGGGVFQAIPTLVDGYEKPALNIKRTSTADEVDLFRDVSLETGAKFIFTLVQNRTWPDAWREALVRSDAANAAGAKLVPQVAGRATGILMGLAAYHAFMRRETYMKIAALPLADRVAEMRKAEVKAAILSDADAPPESDSLMHRIHLTMLDFLDLSYPLGLPLNYEPPGSYSLAALAQSRGISTLECLYDVMLENDGKAFAVFYAFGYADANYDALETMLLHPGSVLGLCDGGAHARVICDASIQTFMLTHWARDRVRGQRLPIELVVKKQTADTAAAYNLHDRGTLAKGMRADINVIDHEHLSLALPYMVYDLPAGGPRLLQPANGYVATIVNGVVTRRNGEDTGERPGRLVRNMT